MDVDNRRNPHPFCPDCGDTGVTDEPIGAFGTHEGVGCWCVADDDELLQPYRGTFPLSFLRPDEKVGAAPSGPPGAAVIETAIGDVLVRVGETVRRERDGRVVVLP